MVESPCISSFVIRLIKEDDPQLAASPYRGVIRHVQSDQELSFTNWSDVEVFIQRFVPIHLMVLPASDSLDVEKGHER